MTWRRGRLAKRSQLSSRPPPTTERRGIGLENLRPHRDHRKTTCSSQLIINFISHSPPSPLPLLLHYRFLVRWRGSGSRWLKYQKLSGRQAQPLLLLLTRFVSTETSIQFQPDEVITISTTHTRVRWSHQSVMATDSPFDSLVVQVVHAKVTREFLSSFRVTSHDALLSSGRS